MDINLNKDQDNQRNVNVPDAMAMVSPFREPDFNQVG